MADRERIEEEVGTDDGCDGEPPRVGVADVAALEVDGAVRAIVALQHGGIWERQVDGTWMVLTPLDLHAARSEDRPPPPQVTEVDTPDPPEGSGGPEPWTSSPTPTLSCASPTTTAVTPNPSNGPPTTYEVCP